MIDGVAAHLLGGHVAGGTEDLTGTGLIGAGDMRRGLVCGAGGSSFVAAKFREAEVENFYLAGLGDKNIFRLEVAIDDAAIVSGIRLLAESTGVFTETAGGATVAAALALAAAGHFKRTDEVVLCITGNGLKTVEALAGALPEAPVIAPRLREVTALVEH